MTDVEEIYNDKLKKQRYLNLWSKIKDLLVCARDDFPDDKDRRRICFVCLLEEHDILGQERIVEVEVERKLKCSEEQLEYQREYHRQQRELKKKQDRKERIEEKMKYSQRERKGFCYSCMKIQVVSGFTPTLKRKPNRNKVQIVLNGKCPECKGTMNLFGGYLTPEDSKYVEIN